MIKNIDEKIDVDFFSGFDCDALELAEAEWAAKQLGIVFTWEPYLASDNIIWLVAKRGSKEYCHYANEPQSDNAKRFEEAKLSINILNDKALIDEIPSFGYFYSHNCCFFCNGENLFIGKDMRNFTYKLPTHELFHQAVAIERKFRKFSSTWHKFSDPIAIDIINDLLYLLEIQ
jgi:hypothetical protein